MSSVLRSISSEQAKFRKDVKKTKAGMKEAWDKKYHPKVDTSSVTKKMRTLRRSLAPFTKKIVQVVAIKDMATSKVKSISSKLKSVASKITAPLVKIKDSASAGKYQFHVLPDILNFIKSTNQRFYKINYVWQNLN